MNKDELKRYLGRTDVYALQTDIGSYFPVRKEITDSDLQAHLEGTKTIGTYVISPGNTVTYACIDIDGDPNKLKELLSLSDTIFNIFPEFERSLEFSGRRGYHIWIFFEEPESAAFAKDLCETRLRMFGFKNIEVFPKQTRLTGKGYGNLIKIPCGLHKKGGQSYLIRKNGRKEI